jgi:hypothetical protein
MVSRTLPLAPWTGSSPGEFGRVTATQERGSDTLQLTFTGHIATINDALILFKAYLRDYLNRVLKRPYNRERNSLIYSGYIFIYVANESGIKR